MRVLCAIALLGGAAAAGTLKLSWHDCGDGSTHGKVTGLTPATLTLGQKTTVTGTGSVDEAVTAGTFKIQVKVAIITQEFSGDLCAPKTFKLPLGVGTVTWDGMKCPLAAGVATISTDIQLSASIPPTAAKAQFT